MFVRALKASVTIAAIPAVLIFLAVACGGESEEKEGISLRIEGGKLIPESVDVKEGDKVTLKVETDQAGEVHVTGFDVKARVEPGRVTDIFFYAYAGRAEARRTINFKPDGEDTEKVIGRVNLLRK